MTRLKAVLNALSESHPSDTAISAIESPEWASRSAAFSMRQRVKYSIGDSPTVSLRRRAKLDRDMPRQCGGAPAPPNFSSPDCYQFRPAFATLCNCSRIRVTLGTTQRKAIFLYTSMSGAGHFLAEL